MQKALSMMLQSKPIKAEEAHKLGLVDHIAPPGEALLAAAMKLALVGLVLFTMSLLYVKNTFN